MRTSFGAFTLSTTGWSFPTSTSSYVSYEHSAIDEDEHLPLSESLSRGTLSGTVERKVRKSLYMRSSYRFDFSVNQCTYLARL